MAACLGGALPRSRPRSAARRETEEKFDEEIRSHEQDQEILLKKRMKEGALRATGSRAEATLPNLCKKWDSVAFGLTLYRLRAGRDLVPVTATGSNSWR